MIIECLGGINFDKINNGIYSYQKEHMGEYPHYLVMNYKTFNEIRYISYSRMVSAREDDNWYFEYHGIPIATCEKLEYGEVDIV